MEGIQSRDGVIRNNDLLGGNGRMKRRANYRASKRECAAVSENIISCRSVFQSWLKCKSLAGIDHGRANIAMAAIFYG